MIGWLVLQSTSALDFVKKDLVEFTNTVQEDTTRVAANVKCKLTVSITVDVSLWITDPHGLLPSRGKDGDIFSLEVREESEDV